MGRGLATGIRVPTAFLERRFTGLFDMSQGIEFVKYKKILVLASLKATSDDTVDHRPVR